MSPASTSTAEPALTITGALALECVRALASGLSVEARIALTAGMLSAEDRAAAWTALMREEGLLTLAEAAAMTPWTESGFKRVAGRNNLPFVKGPHKSPPAYRFADVAEMLTRLRVWPHGKPATLALVA